MLVSLQLPISFKQRQAECDSFQLLVKCEQHYTCKYDGSSTDGVSVDDPTPHYLTRYKSSQFASESCPIQLITKKMLNDP